MHSVINGEIITVRLEQTYKLFIYISIRDFIFLRVHRISDEFFSLVIIKNTRKYKKENVFLDIFKTDQIKYIYIYFSILDEHQTNEIIIDICIELQ